MSRDFFKPELMRFEEGDDIRPVLFSLGSGGLFGGV